MFKKLIDKIFGNHYQTGLERFVASKQPKSNAEVEFWCRHYDQTRYGGALWKHYADFYDVQWSEQFAPNKHKPIAMCMILPKLIGPYNMNTIRQFFNSMLEAIAQAREARLTHNGK